MLFRSPKCNLTEWEEQYILHSLSELKLNFIDEKKKKETDSANDNGKTDEKPKDEEKQKPKSKPKSKTTKKPKKK